MLVTQSHNQRVSKCQTGAGALLHAHVLTRRGLGDVPCTKITNGFETLLDNLRSAPPLVTGFPWPDLNPFQCLPLLPQGHLRGLCCQQGVDHTHPGYGLQQRG